MKDDITEDVPLSVYQAAAYLKVSSRTLKRWLLAGLVKPDFTYTSLDAVLTRVEAPR